MMDYKKLGLKSGIEIHQQLDTNKLFCDCPSIIRDDKPDLIVKRKLKAAAGETGKIDIAAKHEEMKEKYYVYQAYEDTTCLVELDEEPPHEIDKDALDIVLSVAKILNAKIVEKIEVMRKTVVDGSNTSGFQRTALIAREGYIDTSLGKVKIPSICLEEDAAKIVKRDKEYDIYNLSRLGIPLIEITTDPDIKTSQHAKEVAEKLGMILRSTGKVKRGLGTIRQDVNISIKDGNRIEIKGAQNLRLIPKLVEYECLRQDNMIAINKELKEINICEIYDLTRVLKDSKSKVLRNALDNKGFILGIRLKNMAGFPGREIQPGRRLATEYSDYAKMAGVKGLFHSDELPNYGITQEEVNVIFKELKCNKKDAFIIIGDEEKKARKALSLVIERVKILDIPKEVRKANDDGTTSFLRPIPGASRMYPETDVESVIPDIKNIEKIELIEDKIKKLEKEYTLSHEFASGIVKTGIIFSDYVKKYNNIEPKFIANILLNAKKEIKRRYEYDILDIDKYAEMIFEKLNNDQITKEGVFEILVEIAKGNEVNYSKYGGVSYDNIKKEIKEVIKDNKNISAKAIMGIIMSKHRGKVEGRKVMDIINKLTKNRD